MTELIEILKAVLFGLVEGVTEWLPISSTGHLILLNEAVKLDVSENIAGKHVLLIDDIIDSGVTFAAISDMLRLNKPASLKTVALCDKADRRINGMEADYVGFKIPDEFVVGFGLDYAGDYRNLPYIGVLKPAVYARK